MRQSRRCLRRVWRLIHGSCRWKPRLKHWQTWRRSAVMSSDGLQTDSGNSSYGWKIIHLEVFAHLVDLCDSGVWIFCRADPMVVRAWWDHVMAARMRFFCAPEKQSPVCWQQAGFLASEYYMVWYGGLPWLILAEETGCGSIKNVRKKPGAETDVLCGTYCYWMFCRCAFSSRELLKFSDCRDNSGIISTDRIHWFCYRTGYVCLSVMGLFVGHLWGIYGTQKGLR